ncbi:MAG: hypothetical protein RIR18_1587 [Pseudomonadota bacterium]|jgi:exopolyphosphatase/guanosine-5'-triphosphate,3'-diphosphate pyrophosphatase
MSFGIAEKNNMDSTLIAAVDLGSNSFRLQVARSENGHIYLLDNLKFPVRLAAGMQVDKTLSEEAQSRALTALARFGERLRGFSPEDVRVVGTNALRVAHDKENFLAQAEAMLGFPIEVISGYEEARLIYLGAAHALPPFSGHRLVVDIGGGSTEFIIGRQLTPLVMESLRVGCVSSTVEFFPEGRCDKKAFRDAEIEAAREIETLVESYRNTGWDIAVGTSGTAKALAELLAENGMNPNKQSGISRQGLEALKLALLEAGNIQNLRLNGLRADRTPVMAGGLAIMLAVFETLDIDHMIYADGALRQGVLYDLRGRINHVEDLRPETVRQLQRRYQIGLPQANRVEKLALNLFDQLAVEAPVKRTEEDRLFLGWAAELHEIGWAISHTSYHKHGAYILTYADMPGFSRPEQAKLASLILGHRGKLSKLLQLSQDKRFCRMVLSLRLAVLFCRARMHSQVAPHISVQAEKNGYRLSLPAAWLNAHPLSHANLVEEAAYWQGVDVRLVLDCI